ncbi:hypothetical protein NU195Hw_g8603t1 [Hortaea werneckii]
MTDSNSLWEWAAWAFSPASSAIIVTLLVSLLSPLLIHIYLYRTAPSRELPLFLLAGPSGSGKTSLLTLFATGTTAPTHISQEPQTAVCQLPATVRSSEDRYRSENDTSERSHPKFLLLDTPGHGKLRHHAVSSVTSSKALRGILFLVDSAAVSSAAGLTETAEYLHDILLALQKRNAAGKTSKRPEQVPLLVAANKQDVFTSLPAGIVRSKLQEEITRVRQTKSKGLLDSGVGMDDDQMDDEEANWLGAYGSKDFKFEQMEEHGVDVQIVGGNVKGDGKEKGKVEDWWAWVGDNL